MIPERLVRGMKKEEIKAFEESYKAAGHVLRRIAEVLTQDYNILVVKSEGEDNFMLQAWLEIQALNVGERRAIKKLLRYLPKPDEVIEEKDDGEQQVK